MNKIKKTYLLVAILSFVSCMPSSLIAKDQCDLVVFSYDRPMQLYALLESAEKYVTGYRQIRVLSRVTKPFEKGYQIVAERFPEVEFIKQSSKNPRYDFKPLILDILFGHDSESANFVLFAVDDIIVTDYIDLKEGMKLLKDSAFYGLYYRLGMNIDYCYMLKKNQPPPSLTSNGIGYLFWHMKGVEADWGYPNSVDMTLYAKKDIEKKIKQASYRNPNEFEGHWSIDAPPLCLCPEHSKMVNLVINNVGEFRGRDNGKGPYSIPSLNKAFLDGYKIDIEPFSQMSNHSPHIRVYPSLIPR